MSDEQISGYVKLSEATIKLINTNKAIEQSIIDAVDQVAEVPGVDLRALAIAKTNFQTGFMWFNRAIASHPLSAEKE